MDQIHAESRYKLTTAECLCCLCVVTSVEIIALFFSRTLSRPVCHCRGDGSVCRRQRRVWSKLAGTEEEAAVWTGWTAFSSRAFQKLPGASLKQKEEEEVGLPVGTLQTNRDPVGTATFIVDRRSTVTLQLYHAYLLQRFSIMQQAVTACLVYSEQFTAT